MADHVPRLCQECGLPLSAAEKRADVKRCWYHRELEETRQFNALLDQWGTNGGAWASPEVD